MIGKRKLIMMKMIMIMMRTVITMMMMTMMIIKHNVLLSLSNSGPLLQHVTDVCNA